MQVKDTPDDHVTRDYQSGRAKLGDLNFRVFDTSGKYYRSNARISELQVSDDQGLYRRCACQDSLDAQGLDQPTENDI